MARTFRIGVQISTLDPFWVQVREAVYEHAQRQQVSFFSLDVADIYALPTSDYAGLIEELLAQEIEALISLDLPEVLTRQILALGLPIINLAESHVRHPRYVSPHGLYNIAQEMCQFLDERLAGRGHLLVVGGGLYGFGEDGNSRLAGVRDWISQRPALRWQHVPCLWTYANATDKVQSQVWPPNTYFDAVFGFSDSVALAARDVGRTRGLIDDRTLIVGINGDPLALAAILEGSMTATMLTSPVDIGQQAMELAYRAAQKLSLPTHFSYKPQLVTAQNVNSIAAQKLVAIANLPSLLIGDNRRQAQERLTQLETSLKINQQVGAVLNRSQLLHAITNLIREQYGYDVAQVFRWNDAHQTLTLEFGPNPLTERDATGLLAEALAHGQPLFIPDIQHSQRFVTDAHWPLTRSRVVVPIRLGTTTLGLLDLHSHQPRQYARQDLIGLQALADQLGIALQNAELYREAVEARATAERANQLKTRLLANVSHELRTPLNVILGYAATMLGESNPYQLTLPTALLRDVQHIFTSGEHLLRLINDLLDLSRAEIDALELFPETIDVRPFLEEVFYSLAESLPTAPTVQWRMEIPKDLPLIRADPLRLRQILLNLLSNAHKFTTAGEIVMGAEVLPPHLMLWVKDSGLGIPLEQQERIFEPFATSLQTRRRNEGVGLGLTITRHLVLLHGGSLTLESQPNLGSTFRVYIPLPSLSDKPINVPENAQAILVVISSSTVIPNTIGNLCQQHGWVAHSVQTDAQLQYLLNHLRPAALAWDLAHATLDDWGLIQKLQSVPQMAQLPFILYGSDVIPELGVGITDFLIKPLRQPSLASTIEALKPTDPSGVLLIVDDDVQARTMYAQMAAHALPLLTVQTAEGGAQALELLETVTPALVILDLMMPEIDGFAVLEAIRTRPATRRVPVLILSGRSLSFEDVHRLNQMYVTFQSKDLLTSQETQGALERALLVEAEALPPQTSLVVKHAIAYIHQNYGRSISRQELATTVGVSKDYLSHIFQQELGLSPWEFLTRYRIQNAKQLLRNSRLSITQVAAQVGFSDLSYFNRVFRRHVGCSPTVYRQKAVSI